MVLILTKLGPLLLIIYINDIGENLENEILIFADDTTLIAHGSNPDKIRTLITYNLYQ